MSKFTQQEETLIVKNAMELTATIEIEENELNRIKAESFRKLPSPPSRKEAEKPVVVQPKYPNKPKTDYKYSDFLKNQVDSLRKYFLPAGIILAIVIILGGILTKGVIIGILISMLGCCIFPVLIYSFVKYSSKRQELNKQLSETPEYLKLIKDAENLAEEENKRAAEKARVEQEKLDAEYENEKNHYEQVIVPEYNEELSTWTMIRNQKIDILEEEVRLNTEALNDLYDASRIISNSYRRLDLLKWLYDDMSSSDHDIRYATELLDRDRQRIVTAESGELTRGAINSMHSSMMQGFNALYTAIDEGNELQAETISTLSKTRRDMNVGNLVGTVQRHNTNKMLNTLLPKK